MTQNFTLNQLTRLFYGETTEAETSMLLELVELCAPLKATFLEMKEGFDRLDDLVLEPTQETIDQILAYSALQTA